VEENLHAFLFSEIEVYLELRLLYPRRKRPRYQLKSRAGEPVELAANENIFVSAGK
jgi:hypothetical protein